MANQPRLFALHPKPRKPARPARVLGDLIDAGCNYRAYQCRVCRLGWRNHPSNEEEARISAHFDRYGTNPDAVAMCPKCNPAEVFAAWGVEPDEVPDE